MSTATPNPSEPVFSATVMANATIDATSEPPLPDDLEVLKQMVRELLKTLRSQRHENEHLRHHLDLLLRRLYGPRAERFNPDQLLLFADLQNPGEAGATADTPPSDAELPPTEESAASAKRPGHGRQKPPSHLRREEVRHDLTPAERICPDCGQDRCCIGEDISTQLEYEPASLYLLVHVRPKYACPRCHNGVFSATVAAQPIDKGLPGPGLLAQIIVCKFADHLPLYRQERIFSRQGVDLSRQTLCDWLSQAAELLEPLYERLKLWIVASTVLHTDDTGVQVQDIGKTRKAHFWGYFGDREHPGNIFDYTTSRARDGPQTFLKNFSGYLQADAYTGYDRIYAGERVVEVGCNAHARRKFHEARTSDAARAHTALAYYRSLYKIEAEAKQLALERYIAELPDAPPLLAEGLPPEGYVTLLEKERLRLRQEKAVLILADFKSWLDNQQKEVLPKSPMAEAFTYALNQWEALTRYTTAGFLEIDNNWAEREMRRIAIGRKNWLFLGNDDAGKTAAILLSFVSTCQRHAINPFIYFRDVLRRLPTHPEDRLDELLPGRWQPALPEVQDGQSQAITASQS
jgi:transposase